MNRELEYQLTGAEWSLVLAPQITDFLLGQTQCGLFSAERIGQLFARDLTTNRIEVCCATKLKPRFASYASATIDVRQMEAERQDMYELELHFVGIWHTHPESYPQPSSRDVELARDHAEAALGVLKGIVFLIVGNTRDPSSLGVWIQEGAPHPPRLEARLLPLNLVSAND